jgi:hypothetical protein
MYRKLSLCIFCILLSAAAATAQSAEGKADENREAETKALSKAPETKELSGMSIVGNDEAPKSLYIVPWKSSEVGVETSLNMMLNDDDVPVDRDVFSRQIEFYYVSVGK